MVESSVKSASLELPALAVALPAPGTDTEPLAEWMAPSGGIVMVLVCVLSTPSAKFVMLPTPRLICQVPV